MICRDTAAFCAFYVHDLAQVIACSAGSRQARHFDGDLSAPLVSSLFEAKRGTFSLAHRRSIDCSSKTHKNKEKLVLPSADDSKFAMLSEHELHTIFQVSVFKLENRKQANKLRSIMKSLTTTRP